MLYAEDLRAGDLAGRLAAAAADGFDSVEVQFPASGEIEALAEASARHELPVNLINVSRGQGDEVGLAALPGREADFRAAVERCRRDAARLGAHKVNVLAGRPEPGADPAACLDTLVENLRHAAGQMAQDGLRVMVEPLNPRDMPGFFLTGLDPALEVLEAAGHPNLALQFDLYHMAITEPDLPAAIGRAGPRIGHVQFADTPGRHEPGTGGTDFAAALAALRQSGYDDDVAAEYRPAGTTSDGLGWMPGFRRMLA